MKQGSKKTLKPLYLASSSRKDKDEKVLDSMSSNTKNIQKATSSSVSKQKKSSNVFPTQNFHNINKSQLNSILNDSNFKDEKETSKVQNQSMIESQIIDAVEKSQPNNDNSQAVENLNEKITENTSVKNKESVRASVKESLKGSLKGSVKESAKGSGSSKGSFKENTEVNIDNLSRKEKQSEPDNMEVIAEDNEKEVVSQKEIVEEENEDGKELDIPANNKEDEEAADGEDE